MGNFSGNEVVKLSLGRDGLDLPLAIEDLLPKRGNQTPVVVFGEAAAQGSGTRHRTVGGRLNGSFSIVGTSHDLSLYKAGR